MPNFNGGRFIKAALESFCNNEYKNKELIIVDGKSSDHSHNIIQEFLQKNNQIKWIQKDDSGISNAINIGLEHTSGEVIGYLGSDDLLREKTLFKINEFKNKIDFDAIYFDSYTYYIDQKNIQLRKCPNVGFTRRNLIKHGTLVGLQNIFFDKKVYLDYKYDISNKYSMDYEIYFRVIEKYTNFLYVEYPSTINQFHQNISNKLSDTQAEEAIHVMFKYAKLKDYRFIPYKRIFELYVK